MERVYRITFAGGNECTVLAGNAKEARDKAKEQYNLPIIQTVCDLFRSDFGAEADEKKRQLTEKMQKIAFDFINFVREVEEEGLEELVDYKFFTNTNHCHVGLAFSSLVDERELRSEANKLYDAITQSYLTDKEKILLLVNNVKTIEVYRESTKSPLFNLVRKKSVWEKTSFDDAGYGCIVDINKALCDRCDNSYNCFGAKSIFSDKEVLHLLEENSFEVDYPFNVGSELIIKVNLI